MRNLVFILLVLIVVSCVSNGKKYIKVSEDIDLKNLIRESVYEIDKMPGFNPYDGKDFWVWQRRDSLFILENGLSIFLIEKEIKDCYSDFGKNIWVVEDFHPSFEFAKNRSKSCSYQMATTGYSGDEEIILNGMIYRISKMKRGFNLELLQSGNLNQIIRNNPDFRLKRIILPEPSDSVRNP